MRNKEITAYNKRQIELMEQRITDYRNNTIAIGWLIDDLYALSKVIKNPPKDFLDHFIQGWSDLEIPYACMRSDERESFSHHEILRIQEGLNSITNLINGYKKKHLFDEDEDYE